jgi:hypothetical protein
MQSKNQSLIDLNKRIDKAHTYSVAQPQIFAQLKTNSYSFKSLRLKIAKPFKKHLQRQFLHHKTK